MQQERSRAHPTTLQALGTGLSKSNGPYDLRHTHASLLIDLDAHPKAISERMGHSEIGVTMDVYGHLFQDKQERLTNDLDALVERTRRDSPATIRELRSPPGLNR